MVIYLPTQSLEDTPALDELTPREIVRELDKYVIGQADAKRAVAVALRNRVRRQKLDPEMAEDVMPKNILMIGPTGVGKTEIARRLAKLANSPFLKVEASKFTEVGYVGRDVEAMIRDLVDIAIDMVREQRLEEVAERAERNAEERLLDLLMPPQPEASESTERTREKLREKLRAGKLDEKIVELDVKERIPTFETHLQWHRGDGHQSEGCPARAFRPSHQEAQDAGQRSHRVSDPGRRAKAHRHGSGHADRLERVENSGIIFLDEIDKIAGREGGHGPDVSREGVQRDILPIVEGTTVNTRYGFVRTDHILFIAAGAFHVSKPADLIPELQGRFPIRVELNRSRWKTSSGSSRSRKTRYQAIHRTARNRRHQARFHGRRHPGDRAASPLRSTRPTKNIGARRLHTIMEKLLEEISFDAPEMKKTQRSHRWRLRSAAADGHREGSGSEQVHPLMRFAILALAGVLLSGCGYVGDPLPPALNIPTPVSDLRVMQRGDKLLLDFTAPALTTEAIGITSFASAEVQVDDRVIAIPIPKPGTAAHTELPAREWVGSQIRMQVILGGPKGRKSGPSNVVAFRVDEPLKGPVDIKAEPHPEGVRVILDAGGQPIVAIPDHACSGGLSRGGQARIHRQGGRVREGIQVLDCRDVGW